MDEIEILRQLGAELDSPDAGAKERVRARVASSRNHSPASESVEPMRGGEVHVKRLLISALLVGLAIAGGFALVPVLAEDTPPTCGGEPADVVGTSGNDVLVITKSDAVVITNGGEDRLSLDVAVGGTIAVCERSGGAPDYVNVVGG